VKDELGRYNYLSRVLKFFVRSMLEVTRRHLRDPYDLIHVHSVPDFEVFAALIPKLTGARIILDIHDIVPEFYAAKFGVNHKSLVFKSLKVVEKLSAAFADHVIIANDLWLQKVTSRSVKHEKCSAFINYPDLSVFTPSLRTRIRDERFIIVYPGTLNWHQGLDVAIKALALASRDAPRMELHIYGEGSAKPALRMLIEELQLEARVQLKPPVPLREIASIMANSDLGVVPKRNDSFGGEAFSTKILEFMALGIPVVVADTRIDKYYFDSSLVRFFRAGDERDLARAMVNAYTDRALSDRLASKAIKYAGMNSWGKKSGDYLAIVNRLVHKVG